MWYFGINSTRNAGSKAEIALGFALCYFSFPACITHAINPKYHTKPCYYLYEQPCILVMFVVLFTKCIKLLTNTRTPYALVHMMAVHTAFYNELVSRGSGCSGSLSHVHVHWDILTGIDHAFYWSLLTGIDGPVCFKTSQLRSEATRSPNARTTLLTMTSLLSFFKKRNGPPPPPAPLSPLSALPKLKRSVGRPRKPAKLICYVYTFTARAAHLFVLYRY